MAHQYSWRHPETVEITNKSYAERYYNTFSFIDEYRKFDTGISTRSISISVFGPELLLL